MHNRNEHTSHNRNIPRLIALSGKAQTGKTTTARFLVDIIGPSARIFPLAEELKLIALHIFPELTADHVYKKKNAVVDFGGNKVSVRRILIDLGKLLRSVDPDFLVKKMWAKASPHVEAGGVAIVDDMRYPNEMKFFEERKTTIIRIERDGVAPIDDDSETQFDSFEFKNRITNNGGLEDLKRSVEIYIREAGSI